MQAITELVAVDAGYGPFRAVFGVSLQMLPGTATALLGSNGSGKTTVARVITGLVKPSAGRLLVDGEDATGLPAFELARRGIAHVPEGRSVFATLTVEENLTLSYRQLLGRSGVRKALDGAYGIYPILAQRRKQVAGTLSGGQQRMLALARVLPDPPRLLVADELSLGLAPTIVDAVFEMLQRFKESGTALLVIEQHVERALAIADQVVVLQKGSVTYAGPPAQAGSILDNVLPPTPA